MNGKLSNEDLQKIRDVSIYTILGLQIQGRRVSMRCPFPNHRDGTPSFTLYPKNNYYCFGCGATGQGAIDFCVQLGYTFVEACAELLRYI